jgi:hypothetical protein
MPEKKLSYLDAIKVSADLRRYIPRQRAVLFHGTPYPCAILKSDFLIYPRDLAEGGISFTRQLHVAVYWALLGRMGDEQQGAVFVLDRDRLAQNFSLTPFRWRKSGADKSRGDFEAEEKIFRRDISNLHKYILDVIWLPEPLFCPFTTPDWSREQWLKAFNYAGVKNVQEAMKRHKPEEIIAKLRQLEIMVSQSEILACAIHELGLSETTYQRWKKDFGRLTFKKV